MFDARDSDWGFTSFIPLGNLCDFTRGFVVNDTCVVQAEILVTKSENVNDKHVEHIDNPLPMEMIPTSFGELVDFRGLGKVEQDFVPLLEEVCSRHPSLINSKQKRSQRFIEWAFTALGRVLHFLKTKKVRDMDDDAYNHLQLLWEELETFKFDLTWLEPHVQSALGMKTHVERTIQVKKLEENVTALEIEVKKLKTKMIEAEVDLEITRRDLVKAKEGFEECDLDAELGYGGP